LLGSAAGFLGLGGLLPNQPAAAASTSTSESFKFVFMTDIHVFSQKRAPEGLQACVRSINALPGETAFVVTGGDLIMDALMEEAAAVRDQWAIFDDCMKPLRPPVYHTIGNHDIGGWSAHSKIAESQAEFGKALFAEKYGRGATYKSFDHGGWHFIQLDSIQREEATQEYYGWVDDAQLAWLEADLKSVGTQRPIVVITHIPFVSVWAQMNGDPRKGEIAKSLVNNGHVIRKMLLKHNVKLVLSGHGHLSERIELSHFNKTTYIQGGAVSGGWWRGRIGGLPEGYGVVTCKADGTFEHEFKDYGWS
jgi:3',5'-cyclic AMP phosphodiesterase CpdA